MKGKKCSHVILCLEVDGVWECNRFWEGNIPNNTAKKMVFTANYLPMVHVRKMILVHFEFRLSFVAHWQIILLVLILQYYPITCKSKVT